MALTYSVEHATDIGWVVGVWSAAQEGAVVIVGMTIYSTYLPPMPVRACVYRSRVWHPDRLHALWDAPRTRSTDRVARVVAPKAANASKGPSRARWRRRTKSAAAKKDT
jgi:hypothetical protein